MPNKQDCATIVYTPNDASRLALQELENRRNAPNAGMQLGIPIVDKSLLPLRPGQLVVILGRPSNYKSGLMQYLARREALRLAAGNAANEVVVYATWEMAIEELAIYDLAATTAIDSEALAHGTVSAEDWGKLQQAAIQRAVTPTWLIGHSIERRKKRPRLSMDNVAQALLWLDDHMGMKPAVVFLDYLQRMASDRAETDRRLQVAENMERCKDMALSLACPVFVGVQAGR